MNSTTSNSTLTTAGRLARRAAALMILALAAVFAQAPAASAQLAGMATFEIPFEFSVAEKTMPAGEYTVRKVTPTTLVLRARGGESVMFSTTMIENDAAGGGTELVFNRYGDSYFLAKVLPVAAEQGYRIPASDDEVRVSNGAAAARTVTVRSN